MVNSVSAKCRNCGRMAPADKFVLDHVYKMMVCPECVKQRKMQEDTHRELQQQKILKSMQKEEEKNNPPGWDKDDEYLERAHKMKMSEGENAIVERITPDKVKYRCPNCKYIFIYDSARKFPKTCPYCGNDIMKFPNGF